MNQTTDAAHTMTPHQTATSGFPRSSSSGPNLVTLGQLRALRRPRLVPAGARRHLADRDRIAC